MITVKEVDRTYFDLYDQVSMNVEVRSIYKLKRLDSGPGGFIFDEVPVKECIKDYSKYEIAKEYEKTFDISTWRFYMAFDDEKPVGAATVAGPTENIYLLSGRKDACVLWDIRVEDGYKHMGIGQKLFDLCKSFAIEDGYSQMLIETQNINVTACKFYKKQGAVLSKVDMYAYYSQPDSRDEIQFIMYLDL